MNVRSHTASTVTSCWLVGIEGDARTIEIAIDGPILVGRGPFNHVILDDVRLSRQHARVAPEDGGYVVHDLNSINGTFVNDVSVTRQVLCANDVVRFGPYAFRIELRDGDRRRGAKEVDRPTGRFRASASTSSARSAQTEPPPPPETSPPAASAPPLSSEQRRLRALYSFVQSIGTTVDKRELLHLAATKIREFYSVADGVGIYLRDDTDGPGQPFRLARSSVTKPSVELPPHVESVPRSAGDAESAALMTGPRVVPSHGTSMHAALSVGDESFGTILVTADICAGDFSRDDLDMLKEFAASTALMLRNARSYERSRARERLDHDLELAAQIQKSFLPREVISVEGLDLFAVYRAAYEVGGDFYDVLWVGPNRLALFIGDISGKGVSAALLMARISSELRVAALSQVEPVAVMSMMNRSTLAHRRPELFFTAVYMTLDVLTGEVILANAGHPSPYWCHADGRVEAISAGHAGALGILDNAEFKSTTFRIGHGDSLFLYTDGVIEASNAYGELYGVARLERCLARSGTRATDLADHVLRSVTEHGDGHEMDDVTLFVCQRAIGRPASLQPRRHSGSLNADHLREAATASSRRRSRHP